MKVNVTTKEKQFEPIELKLTIESKRELLLLATLGNTSQIRLEKLLDTSKIHDINHTLGSISSQDARVVQELYFNLIEHLKS